MEQWVVVLGNPVDGFNFVGPFADFEAASDRADAEDNSDWWITKLIPPEEGDEDGLRGS